MILIAHRGNYKGREEKRENHPALIGEALCLGFHVEIDVWLQGAKFYLGHDKPVYPLNEELLFDNRVWVHAKNPEAAIILAQIPVIHYFWHESDTMSITSMNYVWTCQPTITGLHTIYMEVDQNIPHQNPFFIGGICSDDVMRFCAKDIS
jgi:hypothetical protein